ncbi:hypothetical protein ACS0TY_029203 [Phlomoides rotata]
MDKGSIFEDAINYTKELQERVRILEEKSEKRAMKSSIEQSSMFEERSLPEVEAKVNDNQILVKVLCKKQKDVLPKLIWKVESLNMMVISTNATSFGDVNLDITVVAEMEKGVNLSVKEVVTALRAAIEPTA